jgi:hypothetical protein
MKTIFFDYNHREQFSKQISTILFFIDLSKKHNYLLVLPRFRFLPSERKYLTYLEENEFSYENFSYFFDFEYLKLFYKNIIEIKDIINLDEIYPLVINTTFKSNEFYDFDISTKLYSGYFNGYSLKFIQKILNNTDKYNLEKYESNHLFFDDVLEQIKSNELNFNNKRNILKYNNKFNLITKNIINKYIPTEYLAVHWRRTDFLLARRNIFGVNKSKEYLVDKCKQILSKYNLNYIYLSTDSNNQEELNYLYSNLPIINIKDKFNNKDFIIIQTLICVNSKIFYGTKTSLFTKNIISLRINNKNNLNFFL